MKQTGPLFLIDVLKVFAALLIILHHLSSYRQIAEEAEDARNVLPGLVTWLFEYGRYAVQIFLVVAGYFAAQSLSRYANLKFSANSLLKLILNRYLHLFAPYATALSLLLCAHILRVSGSMMNLLANQRRYRNFWRISFLSRES